MSKVGLQSLTRRGGPLQGPRLIAAILLITVFIFYFTAPNPDEDEYISYRPVTASERNGYRDYFHDSPSPSKDRESETLSNKFFEYLGHNRPATRPLPSIANTPSTPADNSPDPLLHADALGDPVCSIFAKGTRDLLVVVKTPASELYNQLPARFLTNLRCAPVVVFSYVSQTLGSYDVHDALVNVTKRVREKSRDFDLYNRLQTAQRAYQDFSAIVEDADHNLDRWSIIPSLVAAYKMHPERKWFAYIEGDTYLSLPNLLAWVGQLDHDIPFYAGAQTSVGTTELGSSTAGLIFSNAALRKLALLYQTKKAEWETLAASRCCGDQVLAEALLEANVTLHKSWPNTQRESPLSIDWSSAHWCKAAVTWHRMTPPLMDMLWQFERNWTLQYEGVNIAKAQAIEYDATPPTATRGWFKRQVTATPTASVSASEYPSPSPIPKREPKFDESIGIPPMLYRDYFDGFMIPMIAKSQNRTDWDNFSQWHVLTDTTRSSGYAHASAEGCRAACDIRSKCVQYVYEPNKCRLGTAVRIGEPVAADKRMKSGWLPHRVKKFSQSFGTCGKTLPFLMPDVKDVEPEPELDPSLLLEDSPELGEEEEEVTQGGIDLSTTSGAGEDGPSEPAIPVGNIGITQSPEPTAVDPYKQDPDAITREVPQPPAEVLQAKTAQQA
jgi:hypothetical protein